MRSDPSPPRASSPGERGRRRRRLLQLGILSGDVSVTAGCATLPFWGALIVGAIGGLVNRGFGQLVQRLKARAAPHALLLPLLLPNPSPPPPPLSPSGRWMTRSRRLLSTGRSRRLMWSSTRMEAVAHAHRAARRVNQLGRTRRHSNARVYRYFGAFRALQIVQKRCQIGIWLLFSAIFYKQISGQISGRSILGSPAVVSPVESCACGPTGRIFAGGEEEILRVVKGPKNILPLSIHTAQLYRHQEGGRERRFDPGAR